VAAPQESRIERIRNARTDLVFDHIAAGGSAETVDDQGVRLIHWCAYYGDVSAVRFLLDHGETLESLGSNFDLNGAVFHGHWRLCEFLIEKGADPNHPLPETGETPLHAALCKADQPQYDLVLQVLLTAGADPNVVTREAADTGSFMRDCRTRRETPLHRAAAFGSETAIRLLLDHGARVDAEDMYGDTPLGWASWYNRPAHLLALLCFGEHRIHPEAVRRSREAYGRGGISGLQRYLMGEPRRT
jgi:ankyrin repeat protein